jgi:hypothetical protein
MPRDWWSSARTLTQAARLSQSWRSLKSVEIETLAGLWVSEVDVSTEMGAVGPQDDRVAILEIATKEAEPAEEVASKSTEERIDGQIMKIEEPPDPNVPLTVSAVVVAAAAVVDDLKLEVEEVEDLMVDRAVKVVEELQGTVAATTGGKSFRLNS